MRLKLKSLSLRGKLILLITLPVTLLVTLVLVLAARSEIQQTKESMIANTRALVDALSQDFERVQLLEDQRTAADLVDRLRAFEDVRQFFVFETGGQILFAYVAPGRTSAVPAAVADESIEFSAGALRMFVPLVSPARRYATAYVEVSSARLDREITRIIWTAAGSGIGATLVGVVLALVLQGLVTRPVMELARTAQRISELKDYSIRAVKHGDDELGAVTDAFNAMLWQIQAGDSALKAIRDDLDRRVMQRTASLQAANQQLEQEVSQRKQAEATLAEREERNRLLLESTAEAIYGVDLQGRCTFCNPSCLKLLGFDRPELLIGKNMHELIHHTRPDGSPYPNAQCRIYQAFRAGQGVHCDDEVLWRADGASFPAEYWSFPMRRAGQLIGCVVTFVDISERKELERLVARTRKLEAVGQLAAGIAHELNTPAQYIADNVRFLRRSFDELLDALDKCRKSLATSESADEAAALAELRAAVQAADWDFYVEEIPGALEQSLEGIDQVASIVRAMQEFSHQTGDAKVAVDLNQAIVSTLTICRGEWKNVAELETRLDENLPLVDCLPCELNQALMSIFVNAAHAIAERLAAETLDEGEPGKGKIIVTTRAVDASVEIRVADTGTGIPERIRSRIFDPFFTTKEVGRGTGQGLALAHAVVVDRHGGTIDFESVEGEGTTFIIRLPINHEHSPAGVEDHEEEHSVCG